MKKRASGGGFENPEPSSPKVSCIGQVRVKTKIKQARKNRTQTRSKSCRRNLSFRKLDGDFEIPNYQFQQQEGFADRNQRWVHFPATICRAFGAEFNCFLPCKSFSCMANNNNNNNESGKDEKINGSDTVARWLVTLQDEGAEKIEEDVISSTHRRHVFEELDIENFLHENNNTVLGNDDDAVCIVPPKNALLLMRFRSDPVKMETLANKVWDCSQEGDFDGKNDGVKEEGKRGFFSSARNSISEEYGHRKVEIFMDRKEGCGELASKEDSVEEQESSDPIKEDDLCNALNESVAFGDDEKDNDKAVYEEQVEEEIELSGYASNGDVMVDQLNLGNQENETENGCDEVVVIRENEIAAEEESTEAVLVKQEEIEIGFEDLGKVECSSSSVSIEAENASELLGEEHKLKKEELFEESGIEAVAVVVAKESLDEVPESPEETDERSELELDQKMQEPEKTISGSEQTKQNAVPDCLMLMMREPKLSMEVSKETWICSSDFIRCLPERRPKLKTLDKTESLGRDHKHEPEKRPNIDPKPSINLQLQPPRSSCSFPVAPPLKVIPNRGSESTTAGSRTYELIELPRCKSEPRWSAAKLGPEACFWKNRKLEPHCPAATLGGVGAARLGF
ncbi:hypothetical protein ACFE04_023598 [Oxalis oulophora]